MPPRPARWSDGRSTTRPRPPRCGGSARTAPGSPPAAWTGRRTPAGRTPPSRPTGSAPGCASSTSCWRSTGCAACRTATSATAACTCGSTSSSTTAAGGRFREFLVAGATALRAHGGSLSGEHGDGRARSELLPLMYDEESLRLFAAVKAVCDPDDLLNPGVLVDPAPRRRRPAPGAAARRRSRTALRLDPRRRLARPTPCTAAPASASAWRRHDRRRDVPVVPRHPRREGLHPRPGPGAPGGARRLARARPRRPGGHRGARPLPVLQGLRHRLPDRRRHGDVQGGGAAPAVRRPPAAAVALHAGPAAAAGPRWRRPMAGAANRLARGPLGRVAKAAAGVDRRRSLPAFAPVSLRKGLDRLDRAARRPTCGSGRTRSPTTSCRRPPRPRSGCWPTPG